MKINESLNLAVWPFLMKGIEQILGHDKITLK